MFARLLLTLMIFAGTVSSSLAQQFSEADLFEKIRTGEAFAIMRHALAPGTGDPSNFDVNDCSTQRNLSDAGREQAKLIGERLREKGISEAKVLTSQWCRCRETAEQLSLGEVEDFPALNSFFRNRYNSDVQTAELRDFLSAYMSQTPLVLVTHQVNITALTGVYPSSGEVIVFEMEKQQINVLGSIETPAS